MKCITPTSMRGLIMNPLKPCRCSNLGFRDSLACVAPAADILVCGHVQGRNRAGQCRAGGGMGLDLGFRVCVAGGPNAWAVRVSSMLRPKVLVFLWSNE